MNLKTYVTNNPPSRYLPIVFWPKIQKMFPNFTSERKWFKGDTLEEHVCKLAYTIFFFKKVVQDIMRAQKSNKKEKIRLLRKFGILIDDTMELIETMQEPIRGRAHAAVRH